MAGTVHALLWRLKVKKGRKVQIMTAFGFRLGKATALDFSILQNMRHVEGDGKWIKLLAVWEAGAFLRLIPVHKQILGKFMKAH